jgi:hypothetical protein
MINFFCINKLYFFTSQTSMWFKELYYTIFLIVIVPKKCNLNVWYEMGHKLFLLPSIFNK